MQLDYKIVITGGGGRFGSILKKKYKLEKLLYPNKKELNILCTKSIEKYLKKTKPKILIHLAGLSRSMKMHNDNIIKSIDLNIIGTGNIVKICSKLSIKLIYFSTSYVYEGKKGNYKETDPVLPFNNYAWSKMGGECSVRMYKNSLILRCCMTEKPFVHKSALVNVKANFIFQDEIADVIFKIINKKGILNIGGKIQSIYDFAIKHGDAKKSFLKKGFPKNPSMNIEKFQKIKKNNFIY